MTNETSLQVDDILSQFPSSAFLGGGGQKQVYRVEHPEYGPVVVKIGTYRSPRELERVQREVSVLRDIDSPYFPKQFSFEKCAHERYCIIEEFVPGQTLAAAIDTITDETAALSLLSQLVGAMLLLWSRRVVHRDLKPANIIMGADHARIIDLGIARLLDATSLTMSIAPFGPCTPNYAAPEQLRNQKQRIDHRTDQFTLGIDTAQVLLGGVHPFDPHPIGEGDSIADNIVHDRWCRDALRERCRSATYSLLERMLGNQPYQRFRRPDDLTQCLSSLMEG